MYRFLKMNEEQFNKWDIENAEEVKIFHLSAENCYKLCDNVLEYFDAIDDSSKEHYFIVCVDGLQKFYIIDTVARGFTSLEDLCDKIDSEDTPRQWVVHSSLSDAINNCPTICDGESSEVFGVEVVAKINDIYVVMVDTPCRNKEFYERRKVYINKDKFDKMFIQTLVL